MARCGCASSTGCSCVVQQGNNIVVTGTGSPDNPYVITGVIPAPVIVSGGGDGGDGTDVGFDFEDTGWTDFGPGTHLVNSITPAYRVINRIVYFSGDVKGTSTYLASHTYPIWPVGTLPIGVRPSRSFLCAVVSSAGSPGILDFKPDGSILYINGASTAANMQLGGCSYPLG